MDQHLTPRANPKTRVIVLVVLLLPLFFASRMSPLWMLLSSLMPLMLTGTYRIARIKGEWFESQLHLGFIPLRKERCKLPGVVYIHTRYGGYEPGWGTFMLFGPIQWLFGYVFDYLVPALGGPYEIRLETAKGREVFAWQGYGQQHYEANLELLQNQTGAEVRLR